MTSPRIVVALLTVFLTASQVVPARAASPYELERTEEYAWVGTGLALTFAAGISSFLLEPPGPMAANPTVSGINGFDRRYMQPYHKDHIGDALVSASFVLPFTLLGRPDVREDDEKLALMWFEAALLNQGLVVLTKTVVQRARPYMYDPIAPQALKDARTSRFSFYSGHAAFSAMNSVFTATMFSEYSDDRDAEVAMWAGAAVYSAATAFQRVRTGHHFPTDVVTGLVAGAAIGYLVPTLHRADADDGGAIQPPAATRTLQVGMSFSF